MATAGSGAVHGWLDAARPGRRPRRARRPTRRSRRRLEKAAAEKRQKEAAAWVAATLKKMTLDEKVGQLLFPSINAAFLSTDTEEYEKLLHLVRDLKVGGIPRVRQRRGHAGGPAEPRVGEQRQRVPQGRALRGGGSPQPAPVGVGDPAAHVGRFRGRRRLHPERRDAAAARDGHRRDPRHRSSPTRPAWSAPPRRAPSA